ncbi:MAG: arginine deiminase family protein [Anaerolineales bacterium]
MKHNDHLLPPVTRILARRPAPNFAQGESTRRHLGQPDAQRLMEQYDEYLDALRALGLDVRVLPADPAHPDAHFVEDPVVIFRGMAFYSRSGAYSREDEAADLAPHLADLEAVHIQGDEARLDGGDVLFTTDRVLIGLSARTNRAGAEQLAHALQSVQADLRVDFVPLTGVLHLKTGLTELAPGVLLRDSHLKTDFDFTFAACINLPPQEGYAANALPINGQLLMAAGYPHAAEIASAYYTRIRLLDMTEFEKMDGSLTCLSLRY